MSMSILVEYEEELESRRDEVYRQIEGLVFIPTKYLFASTKKSLRDHLANFHFGYEWIEDGEDLLRRARTEQMVKAEKRNRYEEIEQFEIEPWIDDNTKKLWDLAEIWEEHLATKMAINRDENGFSRSKFHRTGLKRDKTDFWQRDQPTRRRQIKRQKLARRQQIDNQPQE